MERDLIEAGVPAGTLDVPTLAFVAICIAAMMGLFLIFAWWQERRVRALAWWGSAYLIGASSMALWSVPQPMFALPPDVPAALIFIACGMVWNGVRLFHGRRMLSVAAFAGALVWLIALRLPLFAEAGTARVALGALVVAGYTFCIAYELGRERRKSLYSRTAAIVVPSLHAGIFLLPLAMRALLPGVLAQAWLAVFALEIMIYAIGTAFIVLLMVKDHYVHIYRSAASTDGLTGLLNRRAFLEGALALCGLQAKRREPVSLLMFDLDHFKSVNDRFGHAAGDDLLKLFAQTARRCMRADDIIGRFGGEEFVAIVPGDLRIAARIAERIRSSFEQAGAKVGALPIGATVSIGIAMACEPVMEVGALLVRADAALYRAKHDGRNRVFAAGDDGAGDTGRFISAVRLAHPAPAERQKDAA